MKRSIIILLFYLLTYTLSAQTVMVDHTMSLQKMIDSVGLIRQQMSSSDTIVMQLKGGNYRISSSLIFDDENFGDKGATVIIRGEEGTKIIGSRRLGRFEVVNDSLWRINVGGMVSHNVGQLYINGEFRQRAITPNHGAFMHIDSVEYINLSSNYSVLRVKPTRESWEQIGVIGRDEINNVKVSINHKWDQSILPLSSVDLRDSTLLVSNKPMIPYNRYDSKSLLRIEGYREALDCEGEWYFDDRHVETLYYRPKKGENIENVVASIPLVEILVSIHGGFGDISKIRFENIHFTESSYDIKPIGRLPDQSAVDVNGAIQINSAEDIHFENCEFSNIGGYGVWMHKRVRNSTVKSCYIHDLGAGGIKIGRNGGDYSGEMADSYCSDITIDNNIIHHGGKIVATGTGILLTRTQNCRITNNDVADFKYTGIAAGWNWNYNLTQTRNTLIENNHVHFIGWGELSDMGGIYVLSNAPNVVIRGNIVHDIYSRNYGGYGIYTDEGSSNVLIEKNIVYRAKSAGYHHHYGAENVIRNNIFVNQIRNQMSASRVEDHISVHFTNNIIYYTTGNLFRKHWVDIALDSDYNCYFNPSAALQFGVEQLMGWRDKGHDLHSVIADPEFADIEADDYRPTNKRLMKKIGFEPIDSFKCGVYGDDVWRQRALLDNETKEAFWERVRYVESLKLEE